MVGPRRSPSHRSLLGGLVVLMVFGAACRRAPALRNAGNEAVGVGERATLVLGPMVLDVPGEALASLHLRWRRGSETVALELANAPAISTEALADAERRRMGPGVEEDVVFVQGTVMRRLRNREETVIVGMRNPWRRFRLRGGPSMGHEVLAGGPNAAWRFAALSFALPDHVLVQGELRSPGRRVRLRGGDCAGVEVVPPSDEVRCTSPRQSGGMPQRPQ